MKKLLFFLILFVNNLYSQEMENISYRFLNPNVVENIHAYRKAFSTADMSSFRYENKVNVIEFQGGLKVELFSAELLKDKKINLDLSKVLMTEQGNQGEYVFLLSRDNRYILRKFTKTEFKTKSIK